MSTERCEHGNVIDDTMGSYRCWRCEPIDEGDLQQRDRRIEELERVVAELAGRAGISFNPPEAP